MRVIPISMAVAVTVAFAGCSRQKPASTEISKDQQEITALQARFRQAVRQKDLPGVLALMTPDFTQVHSDGSTLSRDQAAAEMRKSWPMIRSIGDWTMELKNLKVRGDTAEADVTERMQAVVETKPGDVATWDIADSSHSVWQRTADGWRYKRMTDTSPRKLARQPGMHFVSVDQWAENSRREREAMYREQRRSDAARAKPEQKAPKGMSPGQARKMLTDLYAQYRQAVRRKDVKAALGILTDDYSVQAGNTAVPRWEVEKSLKQDFARTRSIDKWDMTIQDVAAHGNTLVVVLKESRSAMVDDANGRPRRVETEDRMRDTWVKTSAGWKNQKTEIIP